MPAQSFATAERASRVLRMFILLLMVLILFTAARVLGGKAPGELTRRQRRRIARDARHA